MFRPNHWSKAQTTKSLSAKKITEKLYKVWIYKFYLVPSLTFTLTVE